MKTLNGKLSFAVASIASGQKTSSICAEPRLTVNSTSGKFTITPAVSRLLGTSNGDYVQFLNTFAAVETAIADRNEDIIAYCTEQGIDIDTLEGQTALLNEFGTWYIAKGIQLFDAKGNPKMVSERYTKEDKEKFIMTNAASILEANREALIARLGDENATDEELIAAIDVADIKSPETIAFNGSKASNIANLTGTNVQLSFTDSAIWNQIKADLGEDKNNINRIFDVLVDEAETVKCNNGKEDVDVRILPIRFNKDVVPTKKVKSLAANVESDTTVDAEFEEDAE